MFYTDMLSMFYIIDGMPNDSEIIIIPKDIRSGVDFNMVLNRNDFEEILVKYRAIEPMSETILYAIGNAGSGTIDRSDPIWGVILSNEQIREKYINLCNEFVSKQLSGLSESNQEDDNLDEEIITDAVVNNVVEEDNEGGENFMQVESKIEGLATATDFEISNESATMENMVNEEFLYENNVEQNQVHNDIVFETPDVDAFVPPAAENDEISENVNVDTYQPYIEISAISEEHNALIDEIVSLCDSVKEAFTTYGIDVVCKATNKTIDELIFMLYENVDSVKTCLENNSDCDCENLGIWYTFIELVREDAIKAVYDDNIALAHKYIKPFEFIVYEE